MEFRRVLFRSVRPAGAAAAAGRLAGRHDPLPERRRAVRRLALPPRPDACDVLPRGDVPADRRAARLALRVSGRGRRPAAPLRRPASRPQFRVARVPNTLGYTSSALRPDRQSVVLGQRVYVSVDLGGSRISKKQTKKTYSHNNIT